MNIRAIGDNVLVKRLDLDIGQASIYNPAERFTASKLEVPSSWLAKPITGEVIDVGRGTLSAMGHLIPMMVEIGSVIIFDHSAGSELKIDDETYLILKESEILGVLN